MSEPKDVCIPSFEIVQPILHTITYPCYTCLSCLICVYTMYAITAYFVNENTSKSEDGDFFAGVYESPHFSWILLVFYLMALIGSAGMIYY